MIKDKISTKFLSISFIFTLLFLSFIFIFNYYHIIFNFTSSMPYGFYIKSNDQKINHNDFVSFCLDKKTTELGLKNNYLETGKNCNGTMPLIKQIIALPYEQVYLTESYISIAGKKIKAVTQLFDSNNRKLQIYPRGLYKENCYWVLGDLHVNNSWDSRYWGCISESQIIMKIKPLFIW